MPEVQKTLEMDVDADSAQSYIRTLEDVNSVVHHAKLSRADLKGISQVLYFASDFPDYKLLECDQKILEALTVGSELTLRGRPTDKAVLCTGDTTYDVKSAETSNSLLMVPGLKMFDEVSSSDDSQEILIEEKFIVGVFGEYLELKKIKPRMGRLRELLMEKPYGGPEKEEDSVLGLYSFDDLLENVQASENEIKENLVELEAIEIKGFWRMLEFEYQFRCLSYLLNLIEEQNWPADAVPIGEAMSTMKGLMPDSILDHICSIYLVETENYSDDDSDKLFALNELKVCRFLGEALLRPVDKFNLQDFLRAWEGSVPQGLSPDLTQLEGLALTDTTTSPPVIWYYPESSLPEDTSERFERLFEQRRIWALEDIAPYVARLAAGKQSVPALLTKHARSSNIGGRRMYSARHGR